MLPKIPLDPPLFGDLSEDDLNELAKDSAALYKMETAIITPKMRIEWLEEMNNGFRTTRKIKD